MPWHPVCLHQRCWAQQLPPTGLGDIHRVALWGTDMNFWGRKHLEGCSAEVLSWSHRFIPASPSDQLGIPNSAAQVCFWVARRVLGCAPQLCMAAALCSASPSRRGWMGL